jgi:TonB-dependent SusC/RagA subfamily outer membrane receptor
VKNVKSTYIILVMALLFTNCAKQSISTNVGSNNNMEMYGEEQNSRNNTGSTVVVKDAVDNVTLDNYLKRVSGVNVVGQGANATITVRGINSFVSDTEPLFLVNGQAMSGGYSSIYNLYNSNDIKSVAVLKDAASSGLYGSRGANGVISITLKK